MSDEIETRRSVALKAADKCIKVLKERFGVKEAFIAGSLRGDTPWHDRSDVDIAVEGLEPGRYIEAMEELWNLIPEGIDLDLIPLERLPKHIAAMLKGEKKMDEMRTFRELIKGEILNLSRIVSQVEDLLASGIREPSELELGGLGKYVHDFYNGVERIFERIALTVDGDLPKGERWHTDLLRLMEVETENRSAVIDHELGLKLHRYLRFRHLFRHTYGYELIWDELRPLVEGMSELFNALKGQIEGFLDTLEHEGV